MVNVSKPTTTNILFHAFTMCKYSKLLLVLVSSSLLLFWSQLSSSGEKGNSDAVLHTKHLSNVNRREKERREGGGKLW